MHSKLLENDKHEDFDEKKLPPAYKILKHSPKFCRTIRISSWSWIANIKNSKNKKNQSNENPDKIHHKTFWAMPSHSMPNLSTQKGGKLI